MIQQIIATELKGRIRKDDELKLMLAKANEVKVDTVNRWLREDDVILTTATNLDIIRDHFKLPKSFKMVQLPDPTTAAK
jgi:MOSC domain-containing protein YiiM